MNIVITTISIRYDLPSWSCVNREIEKTNVRLRFFNAKFKNVYVFDVSGYDQSLFTKHGMHMN